jgi:hypothetical protein
MKFAEGFIDGAVLTPIGDFLYEIHLTDDEAPGLTFVPHLRHLR